MSHIERPRFSCVLGGALTTINSLPRVAPIVHASQGCGGNLFSSAFAGSGYLGSGYCGGQSVSSSNIGDSDIVFGGGERLDEQITTTLEMIDADLFVVATSCMTEIIADDVHGVVSCFSENGVPIFAIETGGFRGNSYHGYEKVIEGLFLNYIERRDEKDEALVNILGVVPAYDPFFRGDLEEIKRILEALGLKANTFFTNDQTGENIQSAGSASLNIIFSRAYCGELAEKIRETHGIPYFITDLPVGALSTRDFINELQSYIKIDPGTAGRVLKEEFSTYYKYVDRALDLYADSDFQQYALVAANANSVIPYSKYLVNELGWIPERMFVTDDLADWQKEAVENAFKKQVAGNAELIFEPSATKIQRSYMQENPQFLSQRYFEKHAPAYLLGSSLEKDFAAALGAKLLTVSFPVMNRLIVDRSYAGFRGGLHLFEDIVSSLVQMR